VGVPGLTSKGQCRLLSDISLKKNIIFIITGFSLSLQVIIAVSLFICFILKILFSVLLTVN